MLPEFLSPLSLCLPAYTQRSALEYFELRNHEENMHEETRAWLKALVEMLALKGEKETFLYIRKTLRKIKDY